LEGFSEKSMEKLRYYVYTLVDPRNNEVFYVGKGVGNRVFAHKGDSTFNDTKKIQRINEIEEEGYEVVRNIVNFELSESEALSAEGTLINYIGIENLTNIVKGHNTFWSYSVEEFEHNHAAERVDIDDPVMVIRINRRWHRDISTEELYDITRFYWRAAEYSAKKVKYVLGVYRGLVKCIYVPTVWKKATKGTWDPNEKYTLENDVKRIYFEGHIPEDKVLKKYLNKDIKNHLTKGASNPIQYFNIS